MSNDTPSQLRLSDATSPEGVARERLGRVMDLAQLYADCDLKSLAKALRRDPTRLVCATGNPKVDLVAGLAQLLEWPIADVVHAIRIFF